MGAVAGFSVLSLLTSVAPAVMGQLMDIHDRAATGAVIFSVLVALLALVTLGLLGRLDRPAAAPRTA